MKFVVLLTTALLIACTTSAEKAERSKRQAVDEMTDASSFIMERVRRGTPLPETGGELVPIAAIRDSLGLNGQIPDEDPWGKAYLYAALPTSFLLVSGGPNGVVDTLSSYDTQAISRMALATAVPGDDLIMENGDLLERTVDLRSQQKETMAALCSLRIALETYKDANGSYPVTPNQFVDGTALPAFLEPACMKPGTTPTRDAWGHEFRFWSDGRDYAVISLGSDGKPDVTYSLPPEGSYRAEKFEQPEGDMVLADRVIRRWPEAISACN